MAAPRTSAQTPARPSSSLLAGLDLLTPLRALREVIGTPFERSQLPQPGIPNDFVLSTSCYGARLKTIEDQAFAAVAMGFRRLELGLTDRPPSMSGWEDSVRETGIGVDSIIVGALNARSENMSGSLLGSNLGFQFTFFVFVTLVLVAWRGSGPFSLDRMLRMESGEALDKAQIEEEPEPTS